LVTNADALGQELTEEEAQKLVEKASEEICRRGLQTPAIMMLEMHKPLAGIFGHASVVAAPFAVPFFGFDSYHNYSRLFSTRDGIERLIRQIEESCRAPKKAAGSE